MPVLPMPMSALICRPRWLRCTMSTAATSRPNIHVLIPMPQKNWVTMITVKLGASAAVSVLTVASAAPPIISGFTPNRSTIAPVGSMESVRPMSWLVITCTASASDTLKVRAIAGSAGMIMPCPMLISMDGR